MADFFINALSNVILYVPIIGIYSLNTGIQCVIQYLDSVMNEDEFGHGFVLCGCLFTHLMGQQSNFELFDFTTHLLSM